eukprot:g16899.t1
MSADANGCGVGLSSDTGNLESNFASCGTCELRRDHGAGRYIVASRDFEVGDILFSECALAATPLQVPRACSSGCEGDTTEQICDWCWRGLASCGSTEGQCVEVERRKKPLKACPRCRLAVFCGKQCQSASWQAREHDKRECDACKDISRDLAHAADCVEAVANRKLVARLRRQISELGGTASYEDAPEDEELSATKNSSCEGSCLDGVKSTTGTRTTNTATAASRAAPLFRPTAADFLKLTHAAADTGRRVRVRGAGELYLQQDDNAIRARFAWNNFAVLDDTFAPRGVAVLPHVAMLNHSCDPSAVLKYEIRNEDVLCHVVALRRLRRGDEVTHSYVDIGQDYKVRQGALWNNYGFWCVCARCREDMRRSQANFADTSSGPAVCAKTKTSTTTHSEDVGTSLSRTRSCAAYIRELVASHPGTLEITAAEGREFGEMVDQLFGAGGELMLPKPHCTVSEQPLSPDAATRELSCSRAEILALSEGKPRAGSGEAMRRIAGALVRALGVELERVDRNALASTLDADADSSRFVPDSQGCVSKLYPTQESLVLAAQKVGTELAILQLTGRGENAHDASLLEIVDAIFARSSSGSAQADALGDSDSWSRCLRAVLPSKVCCSLLVDEALSLRPGSSMAKAVLALCEGDDVDLDVERMLNADELLMEKAAEKDCPLLPAERAGGRGGGLPLFLRTKPGAPARAKSIGGKHLEPMLAELFSQEGSEEPGLDETQESLRATFGELFDPFRMVLSLASSPDEAKRSLCAHSGLQQCVAGELAALLAQRESFSHLPIPCLLVASRHCSFLIAQYERKYPRWHPIIGLQRWTRADVGMEIFRRWTTHRRRRARVDLPLSGTTAPFDDCERVDCEESHGLSGIKADYGAAHEVLRFFVSKRSLQRLEAGLRIVDAELKKLS